MTNKILLTLLLLPSSFLICYVKSGDNYTRNRVALCKTWLMVDSEDPYTTFIDQPKHALDTSSFKKLLILRQDMAAFYITNTDTDAGIWDLDISGAKLGVEIFKSGNRLLHPKSLDYRDTIIKVTDTTLILGTPGRHGMIITTYCSQLNS